ncbi:MAG: hypothetical protein U0K66_14280 [Paludibacteraceae bacterium]|jgi:hypothetical protein|nr:hypothetical protein [Paludibacteraceae bacterium]
MTIKALNGGKLLCLMATVAGVMTLGSCNKDDDEPEPEPAPVVPVDTTPKKVVYPDQFSFRLNNSTPDSLRDTIKANTLLADGINSDSISVDVILRNKTNVDPASVSFTVSNNFLGKVNVSDNASITDSIFSVTFPAIEGSYALSINGKNRKFIVEGTGKALSASSRNFSNGYVVDFNSDNTKLGDFTFTPYSETEDGSVYAKISGNGKFVALTEEDYNGYLSGNKGLLEVALKDVAAEDLKASINNVNYFAYQSGEKIYLGKVLNYVGASLREASSVKVSLTY